MMVTKVVIIDHSGNYNDAGPETFPALDPEVHSIIIIENELTICISNIKVSYSHHSYCIATDLIISFGLGRLY